MIYKQSITEAMAWLGEQPDTIFIGQTVVYGGSFFTASLEKVPMEKRIEMPVAEELQLGMSLGLALEGFCVVSIYPRMDFLLLAMNQLVNHIDKLPEMSEGRMGTRIIIRAPIGPTKPLHGGPQHTQNYEKEFASMLKHVKVVSVGNWPAGDILRVYQQAYRDANPAILFVEIGDLYR